MQTFRGERMFGIINGIVFMLISMLMLFPFLHIIATSLSETKYVISDQVLLWPKGLTVDVYAYIFDQTTLWRSMGISVYVTAVGTLLCLIITSMMAYALSRAPMPFKSTIMKFVVITLIFSIPLIPFYLVIQSYGLYNSLWALIVPTATSAFYLIIMKTFFQGITTELFDSAQMDGCNEYRTYASICIPLSLPVLATVGLFHAVYLWNSYFHALIFIFDKDMYPVQVVLRGMIVEDMSSVNMQGPVDTNYRTPEQVKAATIIFATLPILLVYPFIQRFFVKGATVGAIKE